MPNVNDQRDLFIREQKPCVVCTKNFWGWANDTKCMVCRSPLEEAVSINITHTQMLSEKTSGG